jgi:hypothetical protein
VRRHDVASVANGARGDYRNHTAKYSAKGERVMTHGRKACRAGDRCEPRSLDEAIYCVVNHSEITLGVIADRLGCKPSYLAQAANPDDSSVQFQARIIAPITELTKNTAIVRYLASLCGGAFVELPQVETNGDSVLAQFARVIEEIGQDSALIQRILRDGHVTADEAAAAVREIDETVDVVLGVKAAIVAMAATAAGEPVLAK